jgi:hypothetical protein
MFLDRLAADTTDRSNLILTVGSSSDLLETHEGLVAGKTYPQGDSNPCYLREREVS